MRVSGAYFTDYYRKLRNFTEDCATLLKYHLRNVVILQCFFGRVLIDRLHTYCRLNVVLMQTHADFVKNPPPNCLPANLPLVRRKFAVNSLFLRFGVVCSPFVFRYFPLFSVVERRNNGEQTNVERISNESRTEIERRANGERTENERRTSGDER